MTTSSSGGGARYAKLDSDTHGHPVSIFYSKLAFSVRFVIVVCLFAALALFLFRVWGRSKTSGNELEALAHERRAGMRLGSLDQIRWTKKPKSLRTLAPDVKLAVSRCPHPHESSPALLNSIRLLDDYPACKKALFAAACQLEKGLLYDASLPVTCSKGTNAADQLSGSPHVLFVIDANSGGARQVERLLVHLYRQTHSYLLLIPNCFSAVMERLKRLQNIAPNIRLLYYDTQCPDDGTADVSLPQTPDTWRFIVENTTGWNWNYLLSLDSFDFPLLNVDKLTSFLENHAGTNFLESYSLSESSDYVRNITSTSCADGRLWPIGRGKPPSNLEYFQGPPWYLLTRQFLDYALFSESDDKLVAGLRKFASMTPFPAQLLFHTLAHNGRYCHTFVNESLRLTKFHIFDQRSRETGPARMKPQEQEQLSSWTFSPKDFVYLSSIHESNLHNLERKVAKGEKFFARRFDSAVSQQVIYDVESTLYEKSMFPTETPRVHSYWQTLWTLRMTDRRKATLRYAAVARLLGDLCLKRLKRCPNLASSDRVTSSVSSTAGVVLTDLNLFRNFDLNDGLVLSMNISCSRDDPIAGPKVDLPLQCFVNFQHHEKIKSALTEITDLRNDLLHMRVGSDYDTMDMTFRNYAGSVVLDTNEHFGLRTQWVAGEMGAQYQFAWLDPGEVVAGTTFANVGPWTTTHFQPKSEELQYLQSGVWTAAMLYDGKVVGATEFLVLPESPRAYQKTDIKERLRWAKRFYEVNRLCVPIPFSKTFTKTCQCGPPPIPSCETTTWSTLAPDTKSNFPLFLKRSREMSE